MTNSGTAVVVVPAAGVIQPLAVQINTNTTYTIPNITGNYCCYIPATYLVSSSSSSCVLSISTGTGSQVKIPIASNSNSPTGLSSLYLPFYVDTSGDCVASGTETSSGSNSNGNWIQYADGTMIQWQFIATPGISTNVSGTFYSYPIPFASVTSTEGNAQPTVSWSNLDVYVYPISTTQWECYGVATNTQTLINLNMIAIGKWR